MALEYVEPPPHPCWTENHLRRCIPPRPGIAFVARLCIGIIGSVQGGTETNVFVLDISLRLRVPLALANDRRGEGAFALVAGYRAAPCVGYVGMGRAPTEAKRMADGAEWDASVTG